jgi:multimeric flavodoxin WrbA
MNKTSFIILQGSSKSHGNTRKIVDFILSKKEGQFVDLITKDIGYFDYEHKNIDDDFLKVVDQILKCETIIFATPIYWYSMSAVMKTFFDRISDLLKIRKELGRQLRSKKMLVIACGSDKNEFPSFWEPFKLSAEYLGMEYRGHAHVWLESENIPAEVKEALDQLIDKLD